MADLTPIKARLAKCIRLFGSAERANARTMTERALASVGANWTDLGNWIENGGDVDGKYTEAEMQEFAQVMRAEGVEAGIKIGRAAPANNGGGNGHLTLPKPLEMAQYCRARSGQLKDDGQRNFVSDMCVRARRPLSPRQLGYLASIYIQIGGRLD